MNKRLNDGLVITLKDLLLRVFLFLYLLYRALFDSRNGGGLNTVVLALSAAVGVFAILSRKTANKNMLIIYLLVGAFICYVFQAFHFSDSRLFMLYLAGFAIMEEDEEKVVRIQLVSRILLMGVIMLLGGFAQRNGIGANIGTIVLLYMCLTRTKFTLAKWLVILLSSVFLAIINPENDGVLVLIAVVLLLQIMRKFRFGQKFLLSRFVAYIYPISLAVNWFFASCIRVWQIPIVGPMLPASVNTAFLSFVEKLNLLLGTRLSLAKTALDRIGIHLLGGDFYAAGYSELLNDAAERHAYFLVDSGYILLLIKWGLIVTLFVCAISVLTMKYFIKKRYYNFIIAGIALALWPMLEDMLFYGFVLMFWGKAMQDYVTDTRTRRGKG